MNAILIVVGGLIVMLAYSIWSAIRSYYQKGKIKGIEEAVRELQVGMALHLEAAPTPDVKKALTDLHKRLRHRNSRISKGTDRIHPDLWAVGAALAEESWLKGHGAGVRRKAPEAGKLRIDLSAAELLQIGSLANLGFQYMMPNMRLIDAPRFSGNDDALEASRSISKIEAAIPKMHRPDLILQVTSREILIEDWWQLRTRKA
ncbi:hypothetical protein [Bradyrhizobium sp. BR13661]|uniref:hypothetical protein n=1 Tax=Bradyrhizobium sp. BR13661 TaxID=2940622 RepID=UPI002476F8B0|nr:hypothetical protein [Bradyrhizobium sp. BR13661]MDH6263363.1 hypothetical protein [Bradyrhizobium sp. BR13661]